MFLARCCLCLLCCSVFRLHAQEYAPVARSNDAFSLALVKTLQCAANYFKDCRGDSLQYTVLQELEHRLNIGFPGSAAAIVRERFYDRNAYIEFRGYPDTQHLKKGVQVLLQKIRTALGDQLMEGRSTDSLPALQYMSCMLSIKDRNGFFSPNMELMVSSSSSVYLLPGQQADGPKQYFILLKIYSHVPLYNYFIPAGIRSPDTAATQVIGRLLKYAANDFNELWRLRPVTLPRKKKRVDTVLVNTIPVIISRGMQYNAVIDLSDKTLPADSAWKKALEITRAALGPAYVYNFGSLLRQDMYNFYVPDSNGSMPTAYLERDPLNDEHRIFLKIMSTSIHPVKRSRNWSRYDDDW